MPYNEEKIFGKSVKTTNKTHTNFKARPYSTKFSNAGLAARQSAADMDYSYTDVLEGFSGIFDDLVNEEIINGSEALENPSDLVIYSSEPQNSMTFQSILAINVFYFNNDIFQHQYYYDDGGFQINTDLSVETNSFSLRDIASCYFNVKASFNDTVYVIHLANFPSPAASSPDEEKELGLTKKLADADFEIADEFGMGCTVSMCKVSDKFNSCKKHVFDGMGCRSSSFTICSAKQIRDSAEFHSLDASAIDLQYAYDFRDSFMTTAPMLDKWKHYYYRLSEFQRMYKAVDFSNLADMIDLATDVYDVIDRLQNGNNSTIVFDTYFQDKAVAMITHFRSKSNNLDFELIFDDMEQDLEAYVGQTRGTLIAAFAP